MAKQVLHEASYIDMPEEELKLLLGYLHERSKRLKEAEKADVKVDEMKAQLKAYVTEMYGLEYKEVVKKLKGARAVAKFRGIEWYMPKGDSNDKT